MISDENHTDNEISIEKHILGRMIILGDLLKG